MLFDNPRVGFKMTRQNHFQIDEHFSNSFIDINECQWNTHECHHNASCTNTVGDYNCTCKAGFSGDGFDCQGKVILSSSWQQWWWSIVFV